jgi:hypothetical protein
MCTKYAITKPLGHWFAYNPVKYSNFLKKDNKGIFEISGKWLEGSMETYKQWSAHLKRQ